MLCCVVFDFVCVLFFPVVWILYYVPFIGRQMLFLWYWKRRRPVSKPGRWPATIKWETRSGLWAVRPLIFILTKHILKNTQKSRRILSLSSYSSLGNAMCAETTEELALRTVQQKYTTIFSIAVSLNGWASMLIQSQAGAQKGRGNLEHIITLCLLTDIWNGKRRNCSCCLLTFRRRMIRCHAESCLNVWGKGDAEESCSVPSKLCIRTQSSASTGCTDKLPPLCFVH
jgi:hypothetical protein